MSAFESSAVSDLRQVGGILRILQFPPTLRLTATLNGNIALNMVTVPTHPPKKYS